MPKGHQKRNVESPCAWCARETALGEDNRKVVGAFGQRFCSFSCVESWKRRHDREMRRNWNARQRVQQEES